MVPVIVFFGMATAVGCLLGVIIAVRRRAVRQRPNTSAADLCRLQQAGRVNSFATAAASAGLVVVAMAYLMVRLS